MVPGAVFAVRLSVTLFSSGMYVLPVFLSIDDDESASFTSWCNVCLRASQLYVHPIASFAVEVIIVKG